MTVEELRALLADYPGNLDVAADIRLGSDEHRTSLRDIFRDGKFDRTVLSISHWNYGKSVGMPHLSDDERMKQRHAVLDGLADERRPWKWATRRYTSVHGDHRIYHDHGHNGDTCYGTAYDPRVFDELVSEGLIAWRGREMSGSGRNHYTITVAGMALVEEEVT